MFKDIALAWDASWFLRLRHRKPTSKEGSGHERGKTIFGGTGADGARPDGGLLSVGAAECSSSAPATSATSAHPAIYKTTATRRRTGPTSFVGPQSRELIPIRNQPPTIHGELLLHSRPPNRCQKNLWAAPAARTIPSNQTASRSRALAELSVITYLLPWNGGTIGRMMGVSTRVAMREVDLSPARARCSSWRRCGRLTARFRVSSWPLRSSAQAWRCRETARDP